MIYLDFLDGATGSNDSLFRLLGESVSLNGEFGFQFAVTQDLNELGLGDEASLMEFNETDFLQFLSFSECLEGSQVDSLILHAVDILETELRQTTLHRHLTTFETDFFAVTGTGLSTLMTASGGTTEAGTCATSDTLSGLDRAGSRG